MGESSESKPKRANSMEFKATPAKEPPLKSGRKDEQAKASTTPSRELSKSGKRARPQPMEVDDATPAGPSAPKVDTAIKPVSKTPTTAKAQPPNLLLPSFTGTYKLKENPSILKQIAQFLLRTQQPPAKHVYLTKDLPKVKKAIAIGVHGLFPANYLRPMIGQPTGTSIKFANHCAEAIRRWADSHGCEDCEIEKVALEGEGKIGERVENLWKLLLNWIDLIRNADLIIIACHSQGVPVSIMLLAKLIELGVVTSARVGVCAMAGVSLGPFPDYRSSMGMLMGSAAELWAFADPQSEVSQRLEASMKVVLSHGARITFIGSIDDQLVPLESAIYAPAHHPYIFRAVFIDGRIHAPDFIAHLVGFALKLRNLGVSDHGLIRELSTPLAGSLYSGEGHSRLYDEPQVYDLAVAHPLETTDVGGPGAGTAAVPPCEIRHRNLTGSGAGSGGNGLSNPNPYHLPWIMRGLLEEDFVKTELSAETAELVRQFDDWKPVTKALKDVKYRLEAVRSKL
ncbi:1c45cc3c-ed9b-4fdc-9c05-b5a2146c5b50 [Thermothielavioides terrestris]|nr:1c45cc3c-ed9b-4fdc-9c05-b5a2146c5b50 [Thermothielavioides terrestris]